MYGGKDCVGGVVQVQAEYVAIIEKFTAEKVALDELLLERDNAYVGLLQVCNLPCVQVARGAPHVDQLQRLARLCSL